MPRNYLASENGKIFFFLNHPTVGFLLVFCCWLVGWLDGWLVLVFSFPFLILNGIVYGFPNSDFIALN